MTPAEDAVWPLAILSVGGDGNEMPTRRVPATVDNVMTHGARSMLRPARCKDQLHLEQNGSAYLLPRRIYAGTEAVTEASVS